MAPSLLSFSIGSATADILVADITALSVDAIVNAANRSLLGGGGVDGAIHRAAGPELLAECRTLNGCETGSAKITRGYRLPARHVIHTVGPVWHGGKSNEDVLLGSCYRAALSLAAGHGLRPTAFPAISTGAYGLPLGRAAQISLRTVVTEVLKASSPNPQRIIFCCFNNAAAAYYEDEYAALGLT